MNDQSMTVTHFKQLPLLYAILQNLYEQFPLLETRYRRWTCLFLFICLWIINIPGLIPVNSLSAFYYSSLLLHLSTLTEHSFSRQATKS